jgi:hypothetical protein
MCSIDTRRSLYVPNKELEDIKGVFPAVVNRRLGNTTAKRKMTKRVPIPEFIPGC